MTRRVGVGLAVVLLLSVGGSATLTNAQDSAPQLQLIAQNSYISLFYYRDAARKADCWLTVSYAVQGPAGVSCLRDAQPLPTRWEWIPGETQWRIRYD